MASWILCGYRDYLHESSTHQQTPTNFYFLVVGVDGGWHRRRADAYDSSFLSEYVSENISSDTSEPGGPGSWGSKHLGPNWTLSHPTKQQNYLVICFLHYKDDLHRTQSPGPKKREAKVTSDFQILNRQTEGREKVYTASLFCSCVSNQMTI